MEHLVRVPNALGQGAQWDLPKHLSSPLHSHLWVCQAVKPSQGATPYTNLGAEGTAGEGLGKPYRNPEI